MRLAVFDGPAPSLRPLIVSEHALRGHAQTSTLMLATALTERGVDAYLLFGADGPAAADARAAGVTVLDLARWSRQRSRARGLAAVLSAGSGLFHPVHLSSMGVRAVRAGTAARRRQIPTVAHVRTPDDVEAALRLHDLGAHVITSSAAALRELVSRGAHRVQHIPDGAGEDAADLAGTADLCLAPSRAEGAARAVVDLHDVPGTATGVLGLFPDGPLAGALVDAGAAEVSEHPSHEAHVEAVIDLYWQMAGLRGRTGAEDVTEGSRT